MRGVHGRGGRAGGWLRMGMMALIGAGALMGGRPAWAQDLKEPRRFEDRNPRYGGYTLFNGGYTLDSGAPLGGFTPYSKDGGWAKLHYFGRDFSDFKYDFGSDRMDGLHHGNSFGAEVRPPQRGLGYWDNNGRPDIYYGPPVRLEPPRNQ